MVGQKKIQPNPTHYISPTQPIWVGLNPWVGKFIFIIIIKLSKKKYKYKYIKKTQKLVSMYYLKANNTNN